MDSYGQIYPEKPTLTLIEGGVKEPAPKLGGGFFGGGGGGGNKDEPKPWLLDIKANQLFLSRPKATAAIGLLAYQVVGFSPGLKAALLFFDGRQEWVDVSRFSATHVLVEKIHDDGDEKPG